MLRPKQARAPAVQKVPLGVRRLGFGFRIWVFCGFGILGSTISGLV